IGMVYYHHSGHFGNWHRTASLDEGNPNMSTLDVVLSDYYKKIGRPADQITYSANSQDLAWGCSYRLDKQTTNHFPNPATLWDKYFGNTTVSVDMKTLLVDQVLADYKSLRQSGKLGAEDRDRLDSHISHLQTTEVNVKRVAGVCQQLRPASSI